MICENCGKEFFEDWRTDAGARKTPMRFCSKTCANTRVHTAASRLKTAQTLRARRHPRIPKYCTDCGKQLRYQTKSDLCVQCAHNTPEYRQKQTIAAKQQVDAGTHQGWKVRPTLSYAEQMVKNMLDRDGYIGQYITNYPVDKRDLGFISNAHYFLDFYFPKGKIDLEIDGKQHLWPENLAKDKIRDTALESNGYIVHRIQWKGNATKGAQQYLEDELLAFLTVLNKI